MSFSNWKISVRLSLLAGLLAVFMVAIGLLGLFSLKQVNRSLETVYVDRVVPMEQLKTVSDMYAINVVDLAHKSFAVVAEEVRNLAARSAEAARETAELIEGSVQKTRNGTEIAGETEKALREIVSGVVKVTDLVKEIAAAAGEQAEGIGQVNTGPGQIDQVTQANTANAEESAAAAEELSGQAEELRRMLGRFTVDGRAGTLHPVKGKKTSRALPAPGQAPPAGGGQSPGEIIALDDAVFGKY